MILPAAVVIGLKRFDVLTKEVFSSMKIKDRVVKCVGHHINGGILV